MGEGGRFISGEEDVHKRRLEQKAIKRDFTTKNWKEKDIICGPIQLHYVLVT